MPPLQVIQRQVHPSVTAAEQFAEQASQSLARKEQLRIQKIVAATNAKNAQTEQDKMKLSRITQAYDMMEKLGTNLSPELVKTISETVGEEETLMAIQQLGAGLSSRGLKPEDRLKQAQAQMLEDQIGGSGGQGGGTGDRGRLLESMNVGGMTFTDPQAKAQIAEQETLAREKAKLSVERQMVVKPLTGFRAQFNRAVQELGGLGNTALGAFTKGALGKLEAEVATKPEMQAFSRMREGMGLTLASFINRGRPTEPDAVAARKLLPDITYPAATNKALNRFLDALLDIGGDVGPGNEYAQGLGSLLVDVPMERVKAAKAAGLSDEVIEQVLKEYYGSLSF